MLVYLIEISIIMSDGQKCHWSKWISHFKQKKMIEMIKYDYSKWLKWLKQLVDMTILILTLKLYIYIYIIEL